MHDHVRVITQTRQSDGMILNPTKPRSAANEAIANLGKSERVALGAGLPHREVVLEHRKECTAVYDPYVEICGHHQQNDASDTGRGSASSAFVSPPTRRTIPSRRGGLVPQLG